MLNEVNLNVANLDAKMQKVRSWFDDEQTVEIQAFWEHWFCKVGGEYHLKSFWGKRLFFFGRVNWWKSERKMCAIY